MGLLDIIKWMVIISIVEEAVEFIWKWYKANRKKWFTTEVKQFTTDLQPIVYFWRDDTLFNHSALSKSK